MPADIQIQVSSGLAAAQATAVLDLVRRAASADGVSPLSEHARLHLRYGGDPQARDLLLWRDGQLAGYAHLDPPDPESGSSGEMTIDPGFRRQGLGLTLARALIDEAGERGLRLWAHGDLPAADRLAAKAGFERTRSLFQLRRPLTGEIGEPHVAEGVVIRTFRVGQDEDAWVALNHKAFASHPEQGAWTRADLDVREHEPWFDPAGFFLADRDGRLAGFHWTKIHAAGDGDAAAPRRRSGARRQGPDRGGVRRGSGPGRAGHRARPGADPDRPALPARPGPAGGHALRRRRQPPGDQAV